MFITLIISTRNRHQDLKEVLECLGYQKTDLDVDYEILVIDNNSSDGTKGIIDSLMPKFNGKLTYFFEARKGKPYCMNLGIQQAKGEIIAFTDDDCLVEDDYISSIAEEFKNADADIGFIGGKILPEWQSDEIPSWVKTDYFMGRLAILDYGDTPFVIDKDTPAVRAKLFYGANYIFRKTVFIKYGNIDETKVYSQDREICVRLLNNGVKGLYAPLVQVRHKIPANRLKPEYFYQWHYRRGQCLDIPQGHKFKFYHFGGVPFWMVLNVLRFFILSLRFGPKYQRIWDRCQMYDYCGQISGVRKAYNSRNPVKRKPCLEA